MRWKCTVCNHIHRPELTSSSALYPISVLPFLVSLDRSLVGGRASYTVIHRAFSCARSLYPEYECFPLSQATFCHVSKGPYSHPSSMFKLRIVSTSPVSLPILLPCDGMTHGHSFNVSGNIDNRSTTCILPRLKGLEVADAA